MGEILVAAITAAFTKWLDENSDEIAQAIAKDDSFGTFLDTYSEEIIETIAKAAAILNDFFGHIPLQLEIACPINRGRLELDR
jgi:hypothetical protein